MSANDLYGASGATRVSGARSLIGSNPTSLTINGVVIMACGIRSRVRPSPTARARDRLTERRVGMRRSWFVDDRRVRVPPVMWHSTDDKLAGGPGFEPRMPGSEPGVLPLNYPPPGAGAPCSMCPAPPQCHTLGIIHSPPRRSYRRSAASCPARAAGARRTPPPGECNPAASPPGGAPGSASPRF